MSMYPALPTPKEQHSQGSKEGSRDPAESPRSRIITREPRWQGREGGGWGHTARGKQRIWRRREGTEGEDRRDENGEKEGAWYSW